MSDEVTVAHREATVTCDDGTKLRLRWDEIRMPMGNGAVSIRYTSPWIEVLPPPEGTTR